MNRGCGHDRPLPGGGGHHFRPSQLCRGGFGPLPGRTGGGDDCYRALCGGAWWFGIPTSESHALIAGTMGAAMPSTKGRGSIWSGLMRVLAGLVLSLVLGYLLGWGVQRLFLPWEKHLGDRFYVRGGWLRRLDGLLPRAQDGQKFAAVFLIADWIARGSPAAGGAGGQLAGGGPHRLGHGPGTYTGGGRIIRKVGKMVRLDHKSALYSGLAGSISLLLTTLWASVSTTHTKTAAVLGWVAKPPTGGCLARWSLPGCSPSPLVGRWGISARCGSYPCCRVPFIPIVIG